MSEERSHDVNQGITVSRRLIDALNVALVVFTIIVLFSLVGITIWNTQRISQINQRQIEQVKQQNYSQLCAEADIVDAVRKIGLSLGLPVTDIHPPDVTGLDCASR